MKTSPLISQVLKTSDLRLKVSLLNEELLEFQNVTGHFSFLDQPGRSASIIEKFRGPKEKISTPVGQARLLHELCNIELQAMELALRTYLEYPTAPVQFRLELAHLAQQESEHLLLCLNELERRGYQFGHWPIHLQLWQAVSEEDSLLDRLLIVHRYLEGSGLDASAKILTKLKGVGDKSLTQIVDRIFQDEMVHVQFGSRWYHSLAFDLNLDPEVDFVDRLNKLYPRLPKRLEKSDENLSQKAGFTALEIKELNKIKAQQLEQLSGSQDRDLRSAQVKSAQKIELF
ncbi:MAG: DUF455 family protein [Bdellovibrionales bacterium]